MSEATDLADSTGTTRSRSSSRLPSVDFATLTMAVGVSVFLFGLNATNHNALISRVDAMSERLADIPTKSEMGTEIEQVAEIQRTTWDANAARVEASARAMDATAQGIQSQIGLLEANNRQVTSMLNERVNLLDTRIANLGVDYSGAVVDYFRTGRTGTVVEGDGTGGPDGADDVYRDYAIRLAVRDGGMDVGEAIRLVDRAFLNQRGPEAARLTELARSARERNRGAVSE